MSAAIDSDQETAAELLARLPEWFERWEERLSRFREDSELSQLNRAQGSLQRVSPWMGEVIQASLAAADYSQGIVVPTILGALEAAGYDRSFEKIEPSSGGTDLAPSEVADWRTIEFDPRRRTLRLPHGVRLDLGGVAKGWAADRAVGRLKKTGPVMVDASGDIAVSGPKSGGQPWAIAVADPRNPDGRLAMLKILRGGVATSGRDYRRWKVNGDWRHHLIDPRTGLPAKTDIFSVTVVGLTALEAEVAAKVVAILGSQAGLAWLNQRRSMAGLLVLESEEVLQSQRMQPYLWS
jgi:thiamine biosynthesis lipoprotein